MQLLTAIKKQLRNLYGFSNQQLNYLLHIRTCTTTTMLAEEKIKYGVQQIIIWKVVWFNKFFLLKYSFIFF